MKCLCGYEQISNKWELSERLKVDPDFENGEDIFYESEQTVEFTIAPMDYNWDGKQKEFLYACPKCGTIKIDTGN